ncbi:hypothetical protein GY26_20285 [Gammaproteobacteria bacterium MFB021]|nr:hypothetical protein GY26_20285 [Gammaproteobacteria bacterium MFB021]
MRILITGCSSGIGEATARRLLTAGHELIGVSRHRPALAASGIDWIEADLSDPDLDPAEWLRPELAVAGVVHAAGIMHTGVLGRRDAQGAAAMWRLHVEAPARLLDVLTRQAHPLRRVVLIGSRTQQGAAGKSDYAASKAAQQGLVRSWARELLSAPATVNLVAPGATDTPMLRDPTRADVAPALPPMGRFVTPEEVAACVAFLLDDEARSITGQTLTVCAGASL